MSDEVQTTPEVVEETAAPAAEVVEETSAPVAAPADTGADVEVPAKFAKLVEQVESMSVLELNELVKLLEKKFGVSAAAVAVMAPGAGAAAEEKTDFTVELTSDGGNKIAVMKVVKEALALGLKEAKELVDAMPSILKEGAKKEEAEDLKKKIEEAGGKVTLK